MKRENLPFNIPQIDFVFNKFDTNNDGYLDSSEWTAYIIDDRKFSKNLTLYRFESIVNDKRCGS